MEQASEAIFLCYSTPQIVYLWKKRLKLSQSPGLFFVNHVTEFSLQSTQLSGVKLGLILKFSLLGT